MPLGGRAKRATTFVVIVAVIVVGAAIAPFMLNSAGAPVGSGPVRDVDGNSTIPPEFQPDALAPRVIASEGTISLPKSVMVNKSVKRKTILIDDIHGNRFKPEDIKPFTETLTQAGHEVRFVSGGFNKSLNKSDALVVIDPNTEYSPQETARVREFVENGGRVVIFGEPNRKQLSLFGLSVQRSRLVALLSEFGMSLGTEYLYDMETRDGNFQNIIARPAETDAAPEDVRRTTMYTAADIEVRLGKPVLVTPKTTRKANANPAGRHVVAAMHRNGNLLVVGDTSFMLGRNYNVADNEKFLTYVMEFLLTGDKAEEDVPEAIEGGVGGEENATNTTNTTNTTAVPANASHIDRVIATPPDDAAPTDGPVAFEPPGDGVSAAERADETRALRSGRIGIVVAIGLLGFDALGR